MVAAWLAATKLTHGAILFVLAANTRFIAISPGFSHILVLARRCESWRKKWLHADVIVGELRGDHKRYSVIGLFQVPEKFSNAFVESSAPVF